MEARITRKTAALAIFLISAFQTYIYAGRPSSCQLLIINSYTENCLWSDDFMAPVYKEFRVQNSTVDICAEHMELMATVVPDMRKQVFMSDRRWISAQCRKEAEEVMPFLLIGGFAVSRCSKSPRRCCNQSTSFVSSATARVVSNAMTRSRKACS